jgi:hypothetical protein
MSETVVTLDNLFYELRAPLQKNYRKQHVLMAEIKRRTPRELMTGDEVRVPIVLNSLQGGGNPGETGTINVPQVLNTTKALATVQNVVQPFALSIDVEEQSVDNAAAEALALLVEEARNALAEVVNDQYNATGALLATITGGSSPGLTVNVSASATQWDRLYPGRVVDILTRSNGANPGQGTRRRIASVDESAGTVTFDTAQTASDGGSGNITFSANEGIYIAGTYGKALSSLHQVADTTGTFQGINKATTAGWQGVNGRGSDTSTKVLDTVMLDGGVRRGRRNGAFVWEFGVGDPAVIDAYKQSLYSMVRYNDPPIGKLRSGFGGPLYDHEGQAIPLIKEDRFERGQLILVPPDDLRVYGKTGGPEFVKDDGSYMRRFSRALPREVWLRDKQNLVALRCNRVIRFANLQGAA